MAAKWLANFVRLFRPEDSSGLSEEKCIHIAVFRSVDDNEVAPGPLKAVVWIIISILVGLGIGHLS